MLELITTTALVSIWFALVAVMALGAHLLNFNFTVQILIFFITSIVLVLLIRPMAAKHLRGNTIATNSDRLIGMRTRLIVSIEDNHSGEIKANGIIWSAVSVDGKPIDKDTLIEIVAIEGNRLLVRKVQ